MDGKEQLLCLSASSAKFSSEIAPQSDHYDLNGISKFYDRAIPHPLIVDPPIPLMKIGGVSDLALVSVGGSLTLREFIRASSGPYKIPSYFFSDHNHAFFCWCEAYKEGKIETGSVLVRLDEHADSRKIPTSIRRPNIGDLRDVREFAAKLGTTEFVHPAMPQIFSRVINVDPYSPEDYYREHKETPILIPFVSVGIDSPILKELLTTLRRTQVVVDLEVDFFQPHLEDFDELGRRRHFGSRQEAIEHDISVCKEIVSLSGLTTNATGPDFIDQTMAVKLFQRIYG